MIIPPGGFYVPYSRSGYPPEMVLVKKISEEIVPSTVPPTVVLLIFFRDKHPVSRMRPTAGKLSVVASC